MSPKATAQELPNTAESKTLEATVEAVESENPNGEFRLVLSKDNRDRDSDQLWADLWREPLPPKIHMDTDHAWAKGMSVPFTAGSGAPHIDEDGRLIVEGSYAGTDHGQLTRQLVNEGHVWQASVSYLDHEMPDGSIERELLNGTFTGVPANPEAVVLASKSFSPELKKKADELARANAKASIEDNKAEAKTVEDGADVHNKGGTSDGNYSSSEGPFADPKNKKWPLNTAQRVRTAWSYIHQADKTVNYSKSEIATMMGKIRSAARRFNIELDDDNSKALVDACLKTLGALTVNGKLKDHPAQSTPGHTVASSMGAVSAYDSNENDDEDDGSDADELPNGLGSFGDGNDQVGQALHDAAIALGFQCKHVEVEHQIPQRYQPASKTQALVDEVVDAAKTDEQPLENTAGAVAQVVPKIVSTTGSREAVIGEVNLPLNLVTAGPPGREMYSLYVNGTAIAHGELKDLVSATSKGEGRPTGPYQGVEGMSGENASDTEPGEKIDNNQLFLGGTAGAAITPEFKDQQTNKDSAEQPQDETSAGETAAAANKAAAAVPSPADVAARHQARLRAFNFQTKAVQSLPER